MKVYTNIKTLKKAWELLKEMKLEGLLSGGAVKVNIGELIDSLLADGKLNEFCRTITQSEIDFEEMELEDIVEMLFGFFQRIGSTFQKMGLSGKKDDLKGTETHL